ncbi:hypothetical protein Gpo141_00013568 [Globisporangium polare]
MVRVLRFALLLAAAALLLSSSIADPSVVVDPLDPLPSFALPSFDYRLLREGETPNRVLQALAKDGIIALKNVPNYANLRERYLESAVNCALASEQDDHARHLSIKMFADGTKRLTLEATAGRELGTAAAAVDTSSVDLKCPGYRVLHEEFSRTLEHAVNTFGAALDQTEFAVSDGEVSISSRKLVSDAVRLDHFHVYEPASEEQTRRLSAMRELSLPLHEDHGLFIAMAAPKFFSVDQGGQVTARRLVSDASGLVIRTSAGENVRPVLKDDEVAIMMGTGASRWLKTSHRMPAVLHGMRMPEELLAESSTGERNLRAWFGKMTLLPAYQRLLESRQSFAEFTNTTTRYLKQNSAGDLKTIGCATGRRLHDSGGSCSFKKCTLKPDPTIIPPTVGCSHACNYGTEFFDAKCAKKCDCEEPVEGVTCWMLCVAHLDVNECPLENQVCVGLTNSCTLPITEAPTTPAPSTEVPTPEPTTATPIATPAPTTPAPVTPVSVTPTSVTPTTPSPATATPVTPAPVTPASATLGPVTPASTSKSPETPAPTPEPILPVRGQC